MTTDPTMKMRRRRLLAETLDRSCSRVRQCGRETADRSGNESARMRKKPWRRWSSAAGRRASLMTEVERLMRTPTTRPKMREDEGMKRTRLLGRRSTFLKRNPQRMKSRGRRKRRKRMEVEPKRRRRENDGRWMKRCRLRRRHSKTVEVAKPNSNNQRAKRMTMVFAVEMTTVSAVEMTTMNHRTIAKRKKLK